MTQSSITQFFSPVSAEEARTANVESSSRNIDSISQSDSSQVLDAKIGRRSRGNLKIFQLNTAKRSESGSALSHLMGDFRHSLAFITEPPLFHGKVCGFPSATFNILHHSSNNKQCRAAIIASKSIELCPLVAYTDEDTVSAMMYINGRKTCVVSTYTHGHNIPHS